MSRNGGEYHSFCVCPRFLFPNRSFSLSSVSRCFIDGDERAIPSPRRRGRRLLFCLWIISTCVDFYGRTRPLIPTVVFSLHAVCFRNRKDQIFCGRGGCGCIGITPRRVGDFCEIQLLLHRWSVAPCTKVRAEISFSSDVRGRKRSVVVLCIPVRVF